MRRGLLAAVLIAGAPASAAQPTVELAVKATFLPKFAPYVVWPTSSLPSPTSPIALCIIGANPFAGLVDEAAAGVKVEQHPLIVRRLDGAEGAASCQIAFIGASPRRAEMLNTLRAAPVLTVTDARSGPDHGIVHFILEGGRVRFVIDAAMASDSNLSISAKLLSLAASVTPRKHQ